MTVEPAEQPHVLVVDDDPAMAEAIQDCLVIEGMTVSTARNGEKALELLRAAPVLPDAIVLDLWMPVMNGWKFRAEQRRDPALAQVPVLAMSADAGPQAQAIDAAAFLSKPFDATVMISEIRRVVAEARDRARRERGMHTERLAALGRLSGGIAHEINNPLGWMLSNLRALREGLPQVVAKAREVGTGASEELDELVEDLQSAVRDSVEGAERIRDIVQQVRSYYASPHPGATEVIDLKALVGESWRLAELHAQQGVRFEQDLQPTPPVRADREQMKQLFLNVLLNAVDALNGQPLGGAVTVRSGMAEDGRARIEVIDTGPGMSEAVRRRVFEPFFTTKAPGKGTGLGLFVSQGIVRSAGGEIEVDSEPGRGTCVRILLPATREAVEIRGAPIRRVLLIEDEAILRIAFGRTLRRHYDVVLAGTMRDALDLLDNDCRFDAVVCDVHLPDGDGEEFLRAVQSKWPALAHRVLFMTGGAIHERTAAFIDAVNDRVLEKPLDPEKLRVRLEQFSHPPSETLAR